MSNLSERFNFKQHNSLMYNALTNGLAEAFNKTLCNLLKKIFDKLKKDWHEGVGETLSAYWMVYRTPTQAIPYLLIYGVEVVLLLEIQIPSLRIAIHEGLTDEYNAKLCLQELEALNKRVLIQSFQVGDLILTIRRPIITTHKIGSKFTSK